MKKILLTLIMTVLLTSCGSKEDKKTKENMTSTGTEVNNSTSGKATIEGYKKYSKDSVSFEYPEAWSLSSPQSGIVQLTSDLGTGDTFAENLSIISQNYKDQGVDYDTYYKKNIEGVKKMLETNSGKIVSEEDVKIAEVDGKKLVYKFKMQNIAIQTTQYFASKGDMAYIVTITNSADKTDEKKEEFDNILKTLQVK